MESLYISIIVTFLFVCLLFIQNIFKSSDDDDEISNTLLMRMIFAVFIATYISHHFISKSSIFNVKSNTSKIDTKW